MVNVQHLRSGIPFILAIFLGTTICRAEPVDGAPPSLVELAQAAYRFSPGESAMWGGPDQDVLADEALAVDAGHGGRAGESSSFGLAGKRYVMVSGGGGSDFDKSHLGRVGVGLSEFIANDLSLDIELNLLYFSQPEQDAGGANFNLLLRWHFLRDTERMWSLYADAGAGLMLTTADVPEDGSSFNFTPQLGFGASFEMERERRLFIGARWHHVSNANTFEDNPGRDGILVYAAIGFAY